MNTPNWKNRTVWTGDNLNILRSMNSECVDLIYLDPPFNSNRDYSAPLGGKAAGAAFKDTWTLKDVDEVWHGEIADRDPALYAIINSAGLAHGTSMKSYLIMMAVRLLEMRRILKPASSIYLHCDPTASAYLRMVMDTVFGVKQFRNEIVWKRTSSKKGTKKYAAVHDMLLFYSGDGATFNHVYTPLNPEYVKKFYRSQDRHGRYRTGDLTASGIRHGDSGEPWHGIDVSAKGNHWRGPGAFPSHIQRPVDWPQKTTREKLDYLDSVGLVLWPERGTMPGFKRYLSTSKGNVATDVVMDIPPVSHRAKERMGYPTQKPIALLERIILASSNPGDMVLDPFCGCATTCVAAETLGRNWAGIDLSSLAVKLVGHRLRDHHGVFGQIIARTDIPQRTDLGKLPDYRTHKHTLFGRQEGACNGCLTVFPFRNFTIDHIVPQAKGGTHHIDNLQLLCGACNSSKGTGSMEQLIADLLARGIRTETPYRKAR